MIFLDTNVLSELMKANGAQPVLAWISRQNRDDLYTTAITQAEILAGLAILPEGRRRTALQDMADEMFSVDLRGRVIGFDADSALQYAEVISLRRKAGRPIEPPDAIIAAIARVHGAAVATRNIGDFEGCGMTIHDPWRGS